ncbi:glycosyltransferase [Paenibacillus cucumis (ex Kampfer et al. 2016)]|uniref:Glycosyltransferase n=1 Tax=Paenibacillus cucumis (ex Kampfer et al. 2016) TaxID=1776858 RepID=A0ABS7KS84_9BACL|nr:glycosyltransferase [Paenibacillus cucumis (ex Kampfer et al. 2016)]MBY0206802.1 glycosyltransferase [Paenibacillus cucumis (ex Kampfer et al. 2016)]
MTKNKLTCSIVVGLTGEYSQIHLSLVETLNQFKILPEDMELIIVCDGLFFKTIPFIQSLEYQKNTQLITKEHTCDHLAILFNIGLSKARGELVTFLWPGVKFPLTSLVESLTHFEDNDLTFLYQSVKEGIDNSFISTINYGWLQCRNLISLDGAIFRRDSLINTNGFSEEPYLQKYFEWDIFLELSRVNDFKYTMNKSIEKKWDIYNFPYNKNISLSFSKDEIHRSVLKSRNIKNEDTIKVTITGGYWEPTHNQLCFLNYLETDKGKQNYSWKLVFDFLVNENDIANSDLVIISRGKHPNVLKIIAYCEKHNIPTIYMIDDNWFTVGEDWPIYKSVFSPGKPSYDIFIESLKRCDAVILYSQVLESYIAPYSNNIIRLDINVNLKQFIEIQQRNQSRKLIGYSGSPRFGEAAFEGLKRFVNENADWDILVFGVEVPKTLRSFEGSTRLKFLSFTNYHKYAGKIAALNPDILLAPLDNTMSSKSKCPNKFLEITAAGAVGIYSDIAPYSDVVIHNKTGVLISEEELDDPLTWYNTINNLANNENQRSKIYHNALSFVESYYETEVRYEEFDQAILSILKEKKML